MRCERRAHSELSARGEGHMMRAITLRHPWALAVCRFGKDIENRTWAPTPGQLSPGEQFAIHAGKAPRLTDQAYMEEIGEALGWMNRQGIDVPVVTPRMLIENASTVVAVATYRGAVRSSMSRWFAGPVGWQLGAVEALAEPVPCRGAQGLWIVPPDVEASVRAQLERVAP